MIDIGNFYYNRGEYESAYQHYMKTAEYCLTPRLQAERCLLLIKVIY